MTRYPFLDPAVPVWIGWDILALRLFVHLCTSLGQSTHGNNHTIVRDSIKHSLGEGDRNGSMEPDVNAAFRECCCMGLSPRK